MKVTEHQLIILYDTLVDSLKLNIVGSGYGYRWDRVTRERIAHEFVNQQSKMLVDAKETVQELGEPKEGGK